LDVLYSAFFNQFLKVIFNAHFQIWNNMFEPIAKRLKVKKMKKVQNNTIAEYCIIVEVRKKFEKKV
jgi:hypothetical protein